VWHRLAGVAPLLKDHEALGCGTPLKNRSDAKSPDPAWWPGECRPLSNLAPHPASGVFFLFPKDTFMYGESNLSQKKGPKNMLVAVAAVAAIR